MCLLPCGAAPPLLKYGALAHEPKPREHKHGWPRIRLPSLPYCVNPTFAMLAWREQAMTIPPAVTYGLTERGAELRGVLDTLGSIARRWEAEGAFDGTARSAE